MSLILVIFCNLLLFNGHLTAYIDQDSSHNEIQLQNKRKIETHFEVLNDEFLYPMFDGSNLLQILEYTKNPRISVFVKEEIFPVKYQNYEFNIQPEIDNGQNIPEANVDEFEKCVDIHGYNFFFDVIEIFGESIRKIGIISPELISDNRLAQIYQNVNEHCSENLTSLSLGTVRDINLLSFKMPFLKLEDLYLCIKANSVGYFGAFNEKFPKLQRLFLTYSVHNDNLKRSIEDEVPHMEHLEQLEVFGVNSQAAIINKQLEALFQKNPQIRSLLYALKLGDFAQVISNHLPKLERLTITNLGVNIQSVHFDHVKDFCVREDSIGSFEKLSLPRLESLSMLYSTMYQDGSGRDSWIDFFHKHQNIKKLHCSLFDRADGLVDFLAELPKLNEIKIDTFEIFDVHRIRELTETHKNLMKFQYQVYAVNVPEAIPNLVIYHEQFGMNWNVTLHIDERGRPSLMMDRKISLGNNERL